MVHPIPAADFRGEPARVILRSIRDTPQCTEEDVFLHCRYWTLATAHNASTLILYGKASQIIPSVAEPTSGMRRSALRRRS